MPLLLPVWLLMAKFLSKSRVCDSTNKTLIRVLYLYAHAQPIFVLCCKFQINILKTVEVAETRTLLYRDAMCIRQINFLRSSVCIFDQSSVIFMHMLSL